MSLYIYCITGQPYITLKVTKVRSSIFPSANSLCSRHNTAKLDKKVAVSHSTQKPFHLTHNVHDIYQKCQCIRMSFTLLNMFSLTTLLISKVDHMKHTKENLNMQSETKHKQSSRWYLTFHLPFNIHLCHIKNLLYPQNDRK